VLKQDLKTVFSSVIKNMGTTLGACGDVNRNVLAPPAPFKVRAQGCHFRCPRQCAGFPCVGAPGNLLAPPAPFKARAQGCYTVSVPSAGDGCRSQRLCCFLRLRMRLSGLAQMLPTLPPQGQQHSGCRLAGRNGGLGDWLHVRPGQLGD
jgi:hypothetical protein